jgi:heterodisulfide reductase subunit A
LSCDLIGISLSGVFPGVDPEVAVLTGLSLDALGQFQENNVHLFPGKTNRPGIFVVGACKGRDYIPDIITDAKATALSVHTLLSGKSMEVVLSSVTVNEDKCILCLTCIRSCPFQAMKVDGEKEAAVCIPEVCQKCGSCAGECPAKAITLPAYSDDVILSQIT